MLAKASSSQLFVVATRGETRTMHTSVSVPPLCMIDSRASHSAFFENGCRRSEDGPLRFGPASLTRGSRHVILDTDTGFKITDYKGEPPVLIVPPTLINTGSDATSFKSVEPLDVAGKLVIQRCQRDGHKFNIAHSTNMSGPGEWIDCSATPFAAI